MDGHAGTLAAGVVVPAGDGGADQGKGLRGEVGGGGKVVIGEDLAGGGRVEHVEAGVDGLDGAGELVGRELDGGVHAEAARVAVVEALGHDEERVFAGGGEQAAPAGDGAGGDEAGAIDHEDRAAFEADVARVGEVAEEGLHEAGFIGGAVVLGEEEFMVGAVPATSPILVGPHEAECYLDNNARYCVLSTC